MASDARMEGTLAGERVAFVGRLAGMARREAGRLVRAQGAIVQEEPGPTTTLVVVGEEELLTNLTDSDGPLDAATREAADQGRLAVISETRLWERLGFVEAERDVRRLYTPAMLADLLGVSVAVIRRWHRKGLIVPAREVRRLPYFDFQEVATARRLAELLAAGWTPRAIEKKLGEIARFLPHVERPLAQLSIIVEGKQLLLRQGDGLLEPGGQLRFDFEAPREEEEKGSGLILAPKSPDPFSAHQPPTTNHQPPALLAMAMELEDQGQLEAAVEMYRATLAAGGPTAEVNFYLAELLYRLDDLPAARERYYAAIELDEDYVEARANLGCVLAETGQLELAVAAFEGTLSFHGEYPDAHYHLARTLDELGRDEPAREHWRAFLALAPDSPWADQARRRLEIED
jgi:DNA-binding transcriptional MerR regulator